MTDGPEDIVLRYLRKIDEGQGKTLKRIDDVEFRLANIEGHMTLFHRSSAHQEGDIAELRARLDKIEKRLGLIDTEQ